MTTDELRAKFEAWYSQDFYDGNDPGPTWDEKKNRYSLFADHLAWKSYQAAHASRDVEVEALQDALFQISVRLKAEREPDMDDMSWHTDMIARAQYLANLEDAAMREGK